MSTAGRGREKSNSVGKLPPGIADKSATLCKYHNSRALSLYCSFCEKPVCDKCKTTTHARHVADVKGNDVLVQAAKYRRRFLYKQVQKKYGVVVQEVKDLMIHIVESKSRLQSKVDECIRRYQNYVQVHRDKLSVTEEEWTDDVIYRAGCFYNIMDEKLDCLTSQLRETIATLNLIQSELDTSNDPDLLLMFGTLRSALESMQPPKWPREETTVCMKLETVPQFGLASMNSKESAVNERNCTVEFIHEIVEPVVYRRVFDAKLPIPKKALEDEDAKISLSSSTEMFISFGEYIVVYPLDSRRYARVSKNVRFQSIINVGENIIDITSSSNGFLYFAVSTAIKMVTNSKKIRKCFSLVDTPSAVCVSITNPEEIYVGFHDAGKVCKFTLHGVPVLELVHPDPRLVYRPRHLVSNYVGDIFFSDDISNITILDANGIWKGNINRDVKTTSTCGPLRPTGIATSSQRHVFIIDGNSTTNLHIFTEDGRYLQTIAFKNMQHAYVVDVDKTGDVWVAFKDGRIRIYRPGFINSVAN